MKTEIVTRDTFLSVLDGFLRPGAYGIDTETTGLKWYDKDKLFSIQIGNDSCVYYFNFNEDADHLGNRPPESQRLPREFLKHFQRIFSNPLSKWYAHNAKFDLAMLAREGLWVAGTVHCTEAVARLINSSHQKYSLDECLKRLAAVSKSFVPQKSADVWDYILKHKLYKDVAARGKEKEIREPWYHKVPFEVIVPYATTDVVGLLHLAKFQEAVIEKRLKSQPAFKALLENEYQLTKTALQMAIVGIPYDAEYTGKSLDNELTQMDQLKKEFYGHTGREFVDSAKVFAEVFDELGIAYGKTDKGNPSFDDYNLSKMDSHPVVELIRGHRSSAKRAGTYYSSIEYFGANGKIHADLRQAGTATGRVSYREPNMQNVPKEEDPNNPWVVRRCFVPPKDFCLFSPDYDQMEYRMMLDQAEQKDVIDFVIGGLDVHEATAKLMGVTRNAAKTINFMLLYGGGVQKLANALKISFTEAQKLKALYFAKLPLVQRWQRQVISRAKVQRYCENWYGRRCQIDPGFEYKAPNYVIQGGCADVVKIAMNKCAEFLQPYQSKMLLQVHDELLFMLHRDELDIAPKIVEIMENVYPHKRLKLTAGPSYSWKSWGDKVDGYPVLDDALGDGEKTGNEIQRKVPANA